MTTDSFKTGDIKNILAMAKKRKWLIILPWLLVSALVFGGTYFMTPEYESSTIIAIDPEVKLSSELQNLLGITRVLVRQGRPDAAARVLAGVRPADETELACEFDRERRVWDHYLTALKGGASRAILNLAGEAGELAQLPELRALALLLTAGLIRTALEVPGAWIPFLLEGEDVLDRLGALGTAGAPLRVEGLIKDVFPDLLAL